MTKHYLKTYYPGSFFPETSAKEVKKRDVLVDLPKGAYAYQYYDVEEVTKNKEILRGKEKNRSPMYFAGKVYTIRELEEAYPNKRILISNIKGNGWNKVIKTIRGNWQPFSNEDILLNSK